ncbi:related to glutathione S-transferase GST-6.0 [Cephalotrichum gorgonifer]|uniref:Related to glutathione S-transferase GST-6.0 n=1 Tax=Cephalotrichum gorgonifer TaxID=2041049 RepID=A0AAE8T070_9PEZI|nr:related to glutathione S-transferase GST-6.0 [Cephalotrichum gorgonifer]
MAPSTPPTLYRANGTCATVPYSILAHFGIPFNDVLLRPSSDNMSTGSFYVAADGSLSHEDYLAINPSGYVPALVIPEGEGTTSVTEMPAVLTYIASLVPNLNLLGATPLDKVKVAEWTAWLQVTVHSYGYVAYLREGRFVEDPAAFGGIKSRSVDVLKKAFARIEERLAGREFAVGDALTVVDFNLYPYWRWAPFSVEAYPNFAKHMRKIEKLDGIRKALDVEGNKLYFD